MCFRIPLNITAMWVAHDPHPPIPVEHMAALIKGCHCSCSGTSETWAEAVCHSWLILVRKGDVFTPGPLSLPLLSPSVAGLEWCSSRLPYTHTSLPVSASWVLGLQACTFPADPLIPLIVWYQIPPQLWSWVLWNTCHVSWPPPPAAAALVSSSPCISFLSSCLFSLCRSLRSVMLWHFPSRRLLLDSTVDRGEGSSAFLSLYFIESSEDKH